MRRELPIALAFAVGVLMIISFFFTSEPLLEAAKAVQNWGVIIAAFALGLASVNLIQIHAKKITRGKGLDWLYSGALIFSMIGVALLGIIKGPTNKTYQFWFDVLVCARTGYSLCNDRVLHRICSLQGL